MTARLRKEIPDGKQRQRFVRSACRQVPCHDCGTSGGNFPDSGEISRGEAIIGGTMNYTMLSRRSVLAAAAASPFLAQRTHAQEHGRIDVHVHLIGTSPQHFNEAAVSALAEMDEFGVDRAIIMPPPMPTARFDYTDYASALRRNPRRFAFLAGGGTLNPLIHGTAAARVTPTVRQNFVSAANRMIDAGAAGFGEITITHLSLQPSHPFEHVSAEHPLLVALAEVAAARGVVIDLHMDAVDVEGRKPFKAMPKAPKNPAMLEGNIAGFERLLASHRKAIFVWAHGGSDFTGDMTPALIGRLMDAHPNLCMSLRVIPATFAERDPDNIRVFNLVLRSGQVEPGWRALFERHSARFVLGSDSFFFPKSLPSQAPARTFGRANGLRLRASGLLLTRLSPQIARMIAIDNALRIYRL